MRKNTYLGSDRVGYILDSSRFIKKVEYKVKFISLSNKFMVEMSEFESNDRQTILIGDSDGEIKDVSVSVFYDVPDIRSFLDVGSLFNVNALELMKEGKLR